MPWYEQVQQLLLKWVQASNMKCSFYTSVNAVQRAELPSSTSRYNSIDSLATVPAHLKQWISICSPSVNKTHSIIYRIYRYIHIFIGLGQSQKEFLFPQPLGCSLCSWGPALPPLPWDLWDPGWVVGKNKDLTRRFYRYVCMTEKSLNVKFEEGIKMIVSFDIKELLS